MRVSAMPQSKLLRSLPPRRSEPQSEAAPMNVETATQQELDERAIQSVCPLRNVYNFIGRFVAHPSDHARVTHALWIMHAHLMDRWDTTPRLAFLSPEPESGKTRALETTKLLVPRPVSTMNCTPAYIARKIGQDEAPPTILFDEVDAVFCPKAGDHEDLRAILNAGYQRGGYIGRCVMVGKKVETEELSAYAAVALAGLGWLPDTILTRSVVIRMRRRRNDEKVDSFRPRIHSREGDRVRALVEAWAATVETTIDWPALPAGIEDRSADIWEPLLAVADMIGGEWPRRARSAAVAMAKAAKESDPSMGVRLLSDIRTAFEKDRFSIPTAMSSAILVERLIAMEESPWHDLGRGRALDQNGLASRLKDYEIRPRTHRSIGSVRGYAHSDFLDAWKRYVDPPAPSPENPATPATAKVAHIRPVAPVAPVAAFQGNGRPPLGPPGDSLDDFK
jgi:Protein of unknown function (DUF3631)